MNRCENVLLLQGPMGNFFKKLDDFLRAQNYLTYIIGFNLGDYFYSNKDNYFAFKGKKEDWEQYIRNFLKKKQIDKIVLFGDCRFYQKKTIQIAKKMNIDTYVFEEGYIRPNFVTFEKWGVNNFSLIPRKKEFYEKTDIKLDLKIKPVNFSYYKMAKSATIYYLLAYFGKFLYPYYEHHRDLNPYKEFFYGIRNFYRKYKYKYIERNLLSKIINLKYFFVPLQTYNDFQIKVHSTFKSIEEFIELVLISFSKNSPQKSFIVLKHHPMDRGRKDYKKYIIDLSKKYEIENRVIIIYDLHLPTLLKNTLGTITINSTVGLQALYHNSPVKVLGEAIYDIEGLTYQKSLNEFWNNPIKPNKKLFNNFRNYLIKNTQINGSFYGYFDYNDFKQKIQF